MTIKKKYKDAGTGKNLWEAVLNLSDRYRFNPVEEKWIEEQAKQYLDEEFDVERIYDIVWKMNSKKILDLLQVEGYDVDNLAVSEITRKDIDKLIKKYKDNEQADLILKKLKEEFEEDLENKRNEWAWERAWNDLDDEMSNINKEDDQEVADFFNISTEIEYYDIDGETVPAEDAVGFCDCEAPFTKNEIFDFNEDLKEKYKEEIEDNIGICKFCGNALFVNEIEDKEVKLLVSL